MNRLRHRGRRRPARRAAARLALLLLLAVTVTGRGEAPSDASEANPPRASATSDDRIPGGERSPPAEDDLGKALAAVRAELAAVRAQAARAQAREARAVALLAELEAELARLEEEGRAAATGAPHRAAAPTADGAVAPLAGIARTVRTRSNLRAGPGLNQAVHATLPAGTPVRAFGVAGQWTRVRLGDGRSGWIFSTLLEERGSR